MCLVPHRLVDFLLFSGRSSAGIRLSFVVVVGVVFLVNVVFFPWIFMGKIPAPKTSAGISGGGVEERSRALPIAARRKRYEEETEGRR